MDVINIGYVINMLDIFYPKQTVGCTKKTKKQSTFPNG